MAAFLFLSCSTNMTVYNFTERTTSLPTPTAEKLPSSWKGFNLLNMFYLGDNRQGNFKEEEFKMISELGFNFVRIPIDYRIIINFNNWNNINERAVRQIDKAIEYGIKHDIHVCLNFHRAPGYTVAHPPERTNLWTDKRPQEAFAFLWGYFAERYKNVPNEYLSFNLINEPANVDEAAYAAVVKKAADAIWAKDPKRLIIADGLDWGTTPSNMIKELGIAQATRGYQPFTLTHYKAEWVEGSQDYFLPQWPAVILPRFLYGLEKDEVTRSIYNIEHNFAEAYYLDINVGTVSHEARLVVKADGTEIFNRLFRSEAGRGEWTTVVYRREWNIYQNIFNRDYRMQIPAGTKLLTIEVTDGDWMTVNNMQFTSVSGNGIAFNLTPNSIDWNAAIPPVKINADGKIVSQGQTIDRSWLLTDSFQQWDELMRNNGGAMVGEWGAYNKTPHDVVLRWIEDCLEIFKELGMGWALWNFNGSFGILNSERADVVYEDFHGYKLDRKMLDLLLRYLD
jgi:aryl-phospho-beta-D-glucosidase BglC (GH1 family)